jgi:hypothetical protein
MANDNKIGFLKRLWAEALPFVARSPEMKLDWLLGVIRKKSLTCAEISPYVSLLLSEYQEAMHYSLEEVEGLGEFSGLFNNIEPRILRKIIECTDLYDVPVLMELLPALNVDDAVVILQKTPPPYETKPQVIVDQLFQTVYKKTSGKLLEEAAEKIMTSANVPLHFVDSYQRFKEMREDEQVLSSLFPQASGQIRIE